MKHSKASKNTAAGQKRQKVLKIALQKVVEEGWTEDLFRASLKAAKVSEKEAKNIFSDGLKDLIEFFGETTDEAMLQKIAGSKSFARLKIRQKVGFGVRARLESLSQHREAIRRLVLWYAHPTHTLLAVKRLAKTADLIWKAAGDTSEDYNYYTKRFLLAAVIKMTVFYWLQDESKEQRATWEFLERRLDEVVRIGKTIHLLKEWQPNEILDFVKTRLQRA